MKILLVHQYFMGHDDSGSSRFNEMAKVWSDHGHRVTVISGNLHDDKKADRYKGKWIFHEADYYKNIEVFRCHVSSRYNVNFAGRLWAYFTFVFSSTWAGLFSVKGKFDIILVTSPPLFVGIPAYILSRIKRIPLIFEIRDLWPESAIDTGVLRNVTAIKLSYKFESFIYRKAKLINVLTPAFRDKLIQNKKVPPEKIVYIPNAADFSIAEKIAEKFDTKEFRIDEGIDDNFVVSYVGAHGIANHLIQLIEAAELLKDTNVLFQLIGDGMTKPMLIEEVAKRKLKNVRFIDRVSKERVFEYILATDVGASVLKNVEAFKTIYSNKTFDYMSCKKPILLAIDGVSRKLVEEADCGIPAEPENAEDIAEKVRWYIDGKFDLKKQGENGYNFAKKHFDRKVLAMKYLKEMEKIVK